MPTIDKFLNDARRLSVDSLSAAGGSAETPRAFMNRWGKSLTINVLGIPAAVWQRVDTDRPVICQTLDSTAGTGENTLAFYPRLIYAPERIPSDNAHALRSRAGVCYFSNPGTWWVLNPLATGKVTSVRMIDASDPLVAAYYLSLPSSTINRPPSNVTPGGTAATVLAADNERVALVMQNLSASAAMRYTIAQFDSGGNAYDPVGGATADLQRGFRLAPGGEAVFTGDVFNKGRVRMCREDAGASVATDRVELWSFVQGA